MLSRSDFRPVSAGNPIISIQKPPLQKQNVEEEEYIHVVMLAERTEIPVQLFHTFFMSLDSLATKSFI